MARPTTSAAPDDATRAALRHAAHDLLAAEGPAALTVRRLASEAGMSTMNIYSRFGGKDGVVEELYLDGFRRLAEAMAGDGPTDDPQADLTACGTAYRRFALTNPTYYEVMFDRTIAGFVPSPDALATASATLDELARKLERVIDRDGSGHTTPRQAAVSVWATCHGLVSLEMKGVAPPDVDWATSYTRTLEALIAGLA